MGKELTNKNVCVCVYSSPVGVCGAAVLVDGPARKVYISVFAGLTNVGLLGLITIYQLMFLQYGIVGLLRGKKNWVIVFLTFQQSISHTN